MTPSREDVMTTPADSVPSEVVKSLAVKVYELPPHWAERRDGEILRQLQKFADGIAQWAFAQAAKQAGDAPDLAKLKELALVTRADVIDGAPSSWCEEYRNAWADREAGQRNKMIYRAAWQAVSAERDALIVNLESALAQGRVQGLREAVEICGNELILPEIKGELLAEEDDVYNTGIEHCANAIKARLQELTPCQGPNCGTTTAQHSKECIAETAKDQGWAIPPKQE
jgi:hypothetical protein